MPTFTGRVQETVREPFGLLLTIRSLCFGSVNWLCLLLFARVAGGVALGEEGTSEVPRRVTARQLGYQVRHWGLEEGLPLDRINTIAQTKDGYLWIGADSGFLTRFDGAQFVTMDLSSQSWDYTGRYTELLADTRGGLWLQGDGFALAHYQDGRFEKIPGVERAYSGNRAPMVEDADGAVWVAIENPPRFYRLTPDSIDLVGSESEGASRHAMQMATDASGDVWGLWSDGTLFRLTREGAKDYEWEGDEAGSDRKFRGLFKRWNGAVAVCASEGVFELENERWKLARPWFFPGGEPMLAVEDPFGSIWLTFSRDGKVYRSRGSHTVEVEVFPDKGQLELFDLKSDRQGNVWFATHQGLFRISRMPFRTWSVDEGLLSPRILSVTPGDDSDVWLALNRWETVSNLSWLSGDEQMSHVDVNCPARFLVPDGKSGLWLISQIGQVWHWQGGTTTAVTRNLAGGEPVLVSEVLKAGNGEIWIATNRGLYLLESNEFTLCPLPGKPRHAGVGCLAEDSSGRIYASTAPDGIYAIEGRSAQLVPGTEGAIGFVNAMDVTPDGVIWAVFERSQLARWEAGEWHLFDSIPAELREHLVSLCADDNAGLWWSTENRGVVWTDRRVLLDIARGETRPIQTISFGRAEGLGSLACDGYAMGMQKSRDGRVWIATADGVSVIDPVEFKSMVSKSILPMTTIEGVWVDDARMDLDLIPTSASGSPRSDASVSMPPRSGRIEIRYGAIDLGYADRCQFEYRLLNFSETWEQAGNRRSVVFHKVPPGKYTFEVRAKNVFGASNGQVATLAINIAPLWWQRSSAHAALALGIFLAGFMAYRIRLRGLQRRQSLQESFSRELIRSQESERKRISAELHDGLGQELSLIKATSQLLKKRLSPDSPAHEGIGQVINLASQALVGVRRISSDLRPVILDRLGLREAVEALVLQAVTSHALEATCDVRVLDDIHDSETQMNLYRIIQECLNNSLKYAQAKNLRVRAVREGAVLRVCIEDDGQGFSKGTGRSPRLDGGHGLINIRERAQLLHGSLDIESRPGQGARITIEIPFEMKKRTSNEK